MKWKTSTNKINEKKTKQTGLKQNKPEFHLA